MTQDINNIKNFFDLVSCYGIEIPLIQRDYVQGRVHDTSELKERKDDLARDLLKKYTDEREKRDKFVERLVRALLNPDMDAMQLTFLYGTKENTSGVLSHQTESFIPLDGQQRLTTLFLLSWSLRYKLSVEHNDDSIKGKKSYADFEKGLNSLSYKTRPSSREFCACLFKEPIVPINQIDIQDLIQKQTWFRDDWTNDPTVAAILQMLTQFDTELSKYQPKEHLTMMNNLLEGKGISFDILDMKNYQLTDGLYIKMNARGKQLTKFENWKSEFIGFLEEKHKGVLYEKASPEICDVFGNRKPTLREYFEYAIEHQWTDLFWTYCIEQIEKHSELLNNNTKPTKRDKDCYPVIDEFFMNFFTAAHQMLYFLEHNSKEPKEFQDTIAQREETFGKKNNVITLFEWLDILISFNKNKVYEQLFFTASGNQYNHPQKVRLFDGNQTNLLDRCAKDENYTVIVQIIHYGMLRYAQEFREITAVDNKFKSFIRQIRNIAEGYCYVRNNDVNIVNTLQIVDIYSIKNKIDDLLNEVTSNSIFSYSPEHAEIEDFDFIYGKLEAQLLPSPQIPSTTASISVLRNVLKAWDRLDEDSKIQLLVAYGYQGLRQVPCAHGQTFLFGNNNRWKPIFMSDGSLKSTLDALCADYLTKTSTGKTDEEVLKDLLSEKRATITPFSFAYYVLNYPDFIRAHAVWKSSCMYFSIKGDRNALDICAVTYSKKPTLPMHTDPIIYATKEALYKSNTNKLQFYLLYSVQGPDRARLWVYENRQDDEDVPYASLEHVANVHGQGGWKLHFGGTVQLINDDPNKDRIVAGVEILRNTFPDKDFAEKK